MRYLPLRKIVFVAILTIPFYFVYISHKALSNHAQQQQIHNFLLNDPANREAETSTRPLLREAFDVECDASGEWETLGRNVFIKRTAVFYFTDAGLIHLLLLSKTNLSITYQLEVTVFANETSQDRFLSRVAVDNVQVNEIWSVFEYNLTSVSARFNLKKRSMSKDLKNIRMQLILKDLNTRTQTAKPLEVKIKSMTGELGAKKGSAICTKAVHLTKKVDYVSFKWWLELNREIGYEKIFMSNHSIENHPSFNKLFSKNRGFIELTRLKCIPNLQDVHQYANFTYLKNHTSLLWYKDVYAVFKFDIINMLLMNECYLENIDKFKYITVVDLDEVIIPQRTSKLLTLNEKTSYISSINTSQVKTSTFDDLKCDRYDRSVNVSTTEMEAYFNELKTKAYMIENSPVTLHFDYGFYIHNSLVEEIIDLIDAKLTSSATGTENKELEIVVNDFGHKNAQNVTFRFIISDKRDRQYAAKLVKVYKDVIKPFVEANIGTTDKDQTERHSFGRFFYIGGEANHKLWGKTVHDTRSTLSLSLHYVEHYVSLSDLKPPSFHFNTNEVSRFNVSSQNAHAAHFRSSYPLLSIHYKRTPIQELQLDLNYFKCYFMPVMKRVRGK